jgi:tripartite-type tricarboxylate transporter receptor subunit TctC
MQRRQFWSGLATSFLLAVTASSAAHAQAGNYPTKPVTIISDAAAGSAPDVAVRLVADGLTKAWGQQVIVLNRPGANGSIAARAAADAAGDGYTLFMPSLSTFVALPTVAPNLPVKLPRDFLPIGYVADQPMFITMSPSVNAKTLPEFIALAKKEPGKYSVAVSGVGRLTHLTSELLQSWAGIQLISVPYTKGMGNAMADAASGRVSLIIENFSAVIGGVKGGQIKLLAVASPKRLPDFPDVPTVAETFPGFIASGWEAVLAPLGTPKPIIDKISADLTKIVTAPEFAKKFEPLGGYPRAMTPDELQAFVAEQQETWLPIVQKITQKQ